MSEIFPDKFDEAKTIHIRLNNGQEFVVEVDATYDASIYAHDPGWSCYDELGIKYFVSAKGIVRLWIGDDDDTDKAIRLDNLVIGIAPKIKELADREATEIERMHGARPLPSPTQMREVQERG